jgi:hypothetical protein
VSLPRAASPVNQETEFFHQERQEMSKQRSFHSLCAVLLALCLCWSAVPVMAQSQASTGQIAGIVTDNQGAAISGATIKATNTQTGLEQTVKSGDDGLYKLVLLPSGIYKVTGEATGFASTTINNVEVIVGRTMDVKIAMGVSGVQESVNVSAGAVQVQTTRSEADSVLNESAIANLPINGRRFQDFVTLTPGAQVDPSRGQLSISGQRGINANVNVDGVDYNQPFFGGIRGGERSNSAFTIPQESIKEFQVVAAGYSAEFGRSTGGIVNAVTKSGTNAFHGSGFYSHRPKQLSKETDFFNAVDVNLNDVRHSKGLPPVEFVPAPTQQMFGGAFGGPIIKNKAFFFGSYEQQRIRIGRQVFFDNLAGFATTPSTQEAFDFYQSLQEPYQQTNDARAFLIRGDYEINQNQRFNVRYSRNRSEAANAVSVGNALFPTINSALSNNGTEIDQLYTIQGQFTSFFSSSMVNEMRGQFAREERPRPANALEPLVTNTIGNFGTVNFLGQNVEFDRRFQISDNLTWTKNSHTIKFGGEYNHSFVSQLFGFNQFGTFTFNTTNITTLLDLMTFSPGVSTGVVNRFDCPNTANPACSGISVGYLKQIGNLQASYNGDEVAVFAQDSWRIRPNLTINYGLRWEEQYNPSPQANNDTLVNKVKGFVFPSGASYDPTKIPNSGSEWGPRLGVAWDPANDGKMVVRAYTGVYFARTPLLIFASPINNFRTPPGDVTVALPFNTASLAAGNPLKTCQSIYCQFNLIGIDLNKFSLGKLPIISTDQISQIAGKLGLNPDPFFNAQLISVAPDFKNPRSYQAGVGVEREVLRGLTIGADFTYVKAVHLERNRELNIPLPLATLQTGSLRPLYGVSNQSVLRPDPALQGSLQLRESSAKSLYKAFTVSVKLQKKWGQLNAFYTRSKLLSDDDNERSAGGVAYQDSYNFSPEYSYSDLDRRHQFVAGPLIYLPAGFDVSSGIRLRSGRPIDARFGSDVNQDTVNNDRPFLAPGIPMPRNFFRNLAVYNVDFRVQKRIRLPREGMQVSLSMEIFNIFNLSNIQLTGSAVTNFCSAPVPNTCGFTGPTNPNFLGTTDRSPTSTRFGALLLTNTGGEPFQMQFGARFQF